jgi:hypothetical protein
MKLLIMQFFPTYCHFISKLGYSSKRAVLQWWLLFFFLSKAMSNIMQGIRYSGRESKASSIAVATIC